MSLLHPERTLRRRRDRKSGWATRQERRAKASSVLWRTCGQVGDLLKKSIRDYELSLLIWTRSGRPRRPACPRMTMSVTTSLSVPHIPSFSQRCSGQVRKEPPPSPPSDAAVLFTTYHPLLVKSHYVLLCMLMLGDFLALLRPFVRADTVVEGLESYLVFLPPRSMEQAEFVETLGRLAGGWRVSVQHHSRARRGPCEQWKTRD